MSFYQQDFGARFSAMGDEAEGVFDATTTDSQAQFGLNRPPVFLGNVAAFIRYMPDRLQHNRLVECMGIGRDGVLKLKLEKLYALMEWDKFHPVHLFVWDSGQRQHTTQTIWEIAKQCNEAAELQRFPEGKPAWFLNVRQIFHWVWIPHAAA
jgi:hypothetical protein